MFNVPSHIPNKVLDYEAGKLGDLEILELFDELEETGLLYRMQRPYTKMYSSLEREGLVGEGSDLVRAMYNANTNQRGLR